MAVRGEGAIACEHAGGHLVEHRVGIPPLADVGGRLGHFPDKPVDGGPSTLSITLRPLPPEVDEQAAVARGPGPFESESGAVALAGMNEVRQQVRLRVLRDPPRPAHGSEQLFGPRNERGRIRNPVAALVGVPASPHRLRVTRKEGLHG